MTGPPRRQLSRLLMQSDTADNVGDSDDEILALRRMVLVRNRSTRHDVGRRMAKNWNCYNSTAAARPTRSAISTK